MRVPAFIVIGGGDIGATYVRQLLRAIAAGRLDTDRIVVVDRDPACAAGEYDDPRVRIETADWSGWLDAHLDEAGPDDHLVPYHWAPHLLLTWLEGQAARAGARTMRRTGPPPRGLPYEATTTAGDRALSYASWICPPTCIEPALCPHTRGPKDWSLVADLQTPHSGDAVDDRIVFRCLHLVYGVGTIPVADILAARDRLLAGVARGPRAYLVATSSHCHALATVLEVAPGVRCGARPSKEVPMLRMTCRMALPLVLALSGPAAWAAEEAKAKAEPAKKATAANVAVDAQTRSKIEAVFVKHAEAPLASVDEARSILRKALINGNDVVADKAGAAIDRRTADVEAAKQAISAELAKAGISKKVEEQEWTAWLDKRKAAKAAEEVQAAKSDKDKTPED